jgi:hypothetical protein
MNTDALKARGITPLVDLLGEVAKQFPIEATAYGNASTYGTKDANKFRETMLYLNRLGLTVFEDMYPSVDDKNPVSYSRP